MDPAPTRATRAVAASAVAAATLAGLAACGSSGGAAAPTTLAPAQAARAGVSALADSAAATFTLTLDATPADLVALSKAGGGHPIDTALAQALAGGRVVVAAKAAGSSFRDDLAHRTSAGEQVAVDVDGAGAADLVQLVVAGRVLYARADVTRLASLTGADVSELRAVAGALPGQLGFVADALAGRWVEVDESKLTAPSGGTASGSASGAPSVAPSQAAALEAALERVLATDVSVTRAAPDPTLGDHLVLSGDARTIGTDLLAAVKGSLSTLPGVGQLFARIDASTLPSKTVTVDEYVNDGRVSDLRLSLGQLLPAAQAAALTGPVVLDLAVADGATVTPPSSATAVDLSRLGSLSALLGGLGSSGGGSF